MSRNRASRLRALRLLVATAGTLAPLPAEAQPAATLPCAFEPGPARAVAEVLDGETVRLDDNIEVRLVGALAPRAADADARADLEWPPETEARRALTTLVAGRTVSLAFLGERADRYERVLAHLFVGEGDGQTWVQGRLVETGHARAYALPGSDGCIGELLKRERQARQSGLGLWSHAAYQVRPADRPTEVERYRFTFQLVRGRVERARQSGGLAVLELASGERAPAEAGGSQRGAFRVTWKRNGWRSAGLSRVEAYEGRSVLVRGWIDVVRGPEIEVQSAGQLEIDD